MASQLDWSAMLQRHDRWLRTVVFARTGERDAVDEVMQEVSLAAVRQSAPLQDASKAAPWLYRLAVRESLLYRRRMGRRRKLHDRFFAERVRSSCDRDADSDPLAWLLADERRQMVRTAVARLSRGDAEILLLKYTEHWSYQQLADQLGVSTSAVEARLHRARRRLRSQLVALDVVEVTR